MNGYNICTQERYVGTFSGKSQRSCGLAFGRRHQENTSVCNNCTRGLLFLYEGRKGRHGETKNREGEAHREIVRSCGNPQINIYVCVPILYAHMYGQCTNTSAYDIIKTRGRCFVLQTSPRINHRNNKGVNVCAVSIDIPQRGATANQCT